MEKYVTKYIDGFGDCLKLSLFFIYEFFSMINNSVPVIPTCDPNLKGFILENAKNIPNISKEDKENISEDDGVPDQDLENYGE